MKRLMFTSVPIVLTLLLISWGFKGHQTIGLIAERHLSPQAKAAVKALLNGQSLSDVASWADEVRNQPEYKHTAPWHFVNVPLGLNEAAFANAVESSPKQNLLTAIHKAEADLASPRTTLEQKTIALKFLVHFIGDAHQPMHVSREEDKGGNTIQVQFDDKGTNLHALWDSKLIDKQGLSGDALIKKIDTANPEQIGRWQGTAPITWLYESYQISSQLYKEVESNNKLGDEHYKSHIDIVNKRLEQAGIRLAGLLNSLFKRGLPPSITVTEQATSPPVISESQHIDATDAAKHIGDYVIVRGKVFGYKELGSMTLVNVGAAYPDQHLTVVLRGDAKSMAPSLDKMTIEIKGKVIDYKGKPEIEVKDKSSILIILNVGHISGKGGK